MGMLQMKTYVSDANATIIVAAADPKKKFKLVRWDISFDAAETSDPNVEFGATPKYTAGPYLEKGVQYGFNMQGAIPYDKLPVTDYNESLNITKATNACTTNIWYEEV